MAKREEGSEAAGDTPKKGKSGMIKIIILLVLVGLLGGGGYFAWAKFLKKESEPVKTVEVQHPISFELGNFLVNLADPGGKRYLKIALQLELSGQRAGDEINRRNVEVRDMMLMILSSKEYEQIGSMNGKLSLKKEIITRMNKMLQDGQIKEVYFTEFLVQ
jgi:flagellar protein FliL